MQLPYTDIMKNKNLIEKKILSLARELKGTEGSKAHRIRGQIEVLNWVVE